MRLTRLALGVVLSLSTMPYTVLADSGNAEASRRVACMKAEGARAGCTGFRLRQRQAVPSASRQKTGAAAQKSHPAPPPPDPTMDPRAPLARLEQRLLIREIAQLERLFGDMRRKDPQRAQVVRRLAESYADLARAAERRATAAEIEAEAAAKKARGKAAEGKHPKRRSKPKGDGSTRPSSPYPTRL